VITDLVQVPETQVRDGEADGLNDAATIFAVVSALHEADLEGPEVDLVRRTRESFLAGLEALELDEVALFEYIADRVAANDWEGLGLPRPDD
jgi:hypothetical protein